MSRWNRYWFAEGGRLSCAVLRIAIAVALVLSLVRLHGTWPADAPGAPFASGVYRPVGIWMLLGHQVPMDAVIAALWVLAWIGALMMLAGLATRTATCVAFFAGVALASLSYSATKSWSHQYNVVFLALLAFQGARGGDVLSIDALVRRWRGLPALDLARGYQWSIRLVQLAVAVMFASGMWQKVFQHHTLSLRWVFSDNLRNHLLVRYDLEGIARPAIVDWLIDDAWRFRAVALLNLVSQTLPLVACFLVRRPVLRAACGAFFAIETVALGAVMALWNLHWLPLVVVFVDWEALLGALRRRRTASMEGTPRPWARPLAPRLFVAIFVVYDAIAAFGPDLDQRLNTYPISRFPMFATIRAPRPYGEHLPYSVAGVHFEVIADRPAPDVEQWLDTRYRSIAQARDADDVHARLAAILGDVRASFPDRSARGVRVFLTIFEAPAYPAPARLVPHSIALYGELDGAFHSMLGGSRRDGAHVVVTPHAEGVDASHAQLVYYGDDVPTSHDLAAGPSPWTIEPVHGDPVYFVAIAGGRPWLVESTRAYRAER